MKKSKEFQTVVSHFQMCFEGIIPAEERSETKEVQKYLFFRFSTPIRLEKNS
jgi:hypothetical protein